MTIKILVPNNGTDSLEFGSAVTDVAAEIVGTEISSGEGKLVFKTTTSGTSTERIRLLNNGKLEAQSPASATGLQPFTIDWKNENNAGIMASIACDRTASSAAPGALVFRTSTSVDSGAISEKMRVMPNGKVGIGATAPAEMLSLQGGDIRLQQAGGRIAQLNSGGAYTLGSSGGSAIRFDELAGGQHEIAFETHESGVSHAERMRITKNGTVNLSVPLPAASGGTGGTTGGGKVLQVLQAVKSDAFSTTSTSLVDVSGLSVTITPTSTSSKILVTVDLHISSSYYTSHAQLVRGSTHLYKGNAAGNRPIDTITFAQNDSADGIMQRSSATYLDSPSTTSATTYKIQASARKDGGHAGYINRTEQDRDTTGYDNRGASSITVMEIGA
jgi:hypothetical protein